MTDGADLCVGDSTGNYPARDKRLAGVARSDPRFVTRSVKTSRYPPAGRDATRRDRSRDRSHESIDVADRSEYDRQYVRECRGILTAVLPRTLARVSVVPRVRAAILFKSLRVHHFRSRVT